MNYHDRRNRAIEREAAAAKRAAGLRYFGERVQREDIEARMAEIPYDTRDLTARIFGDPLPGRSALDRMGGRPA